MRLYVVILLQYLFVDVFFKMSLNKTHTKPVKLVMSVYDDLISTTSVARQPVTLSGVPVAFPGSDSNGELYY